MEKYIHMVLYYLINVKIIIVTISPPKINH